MSKRAEPDECDCSRHGRPVCDCPPDLLNLNMGIAELPGPSSAARPKGEARRPGRSPVVGESSASPAAAPTAPAAAPTVAPAAPAPARARPPPRANGTRGYYSKEEVALHAAPDDCWIVAHGRVYDATPFLHKHPAGAKTILKRAGGDATRDFDFHSKGAQKRDWAPLQIGYLDSGEAGCVIS